MSEVTFKLSGMQGIIALVAVLALVGVRLATLGESEDEGLHTAIRAELLNHLGADLGPALRDLDPSDPEAVERVLELADEENIELHSVKVSAPLLSMSSNQRTIVFVEYTLPNGDRESDYWRFSNALVGGWVYRGPSTALSYYLNFF